MARKKEPTDPMHIGKTMQHDMAMTAEEVGKALGISRQAVSMMEHAIFRKIRKALLKRGINPQDILPDD